MTQFEGVSLQTLKSIRDELLRMKSKRDNLLMEVVQAYRRELSSTPREMDSKFPLFMTFFNPVGNPNRPWDKAELSWTLVLNKDLSKDSILDLGSGTEIPSHYVGRPHYDDSGLNLGENYPTASLGMTPEQLKA